MRMLATFSAMLLAGMVPACGPRDRAAEQAQAAGAAGAIATADARPSTAVTAMLPAAAPVSLCAEADGAFLAAKLRGALDADINWRGASLQCEGGMRPDGSGLRAAFAGEMPSTEGGAPEGAEPRRLRFIFGIGLTDEAPGKAQALPTNLTVILEGEQTLFTTRGDDRCSAEITSRAPAPGAGKGRDRIAVRGYCIVPAEDATGENRLLVPTFEFTGFIRTGEDP